MSSDVSLPIAAVHAAPSNSNATLAGQRVNDARHPNYVRSVMSASQIPFSCHPRCATLSFERKLLIRMNNVDAKSEYFYLSAFIESGSKRCH